MKNVWLTRLIISLGVLVGLGGLAIGNDYYTHGGFPATGSQGSSAQMRAELDLITAGFNKLPSFAGNANKVVVINSGATALGVTAGTLSLGGNLSLSGAFSTTGAFGTTLAQTATTTLTLPAINGTLATLAGTEVFTTKTFNLANNTLTGTTAQFNTALSDNDFATLAGAESLSNKTIPSPIFSGTITGTYTLGGTQTITSPAISNPAFSGTATGSLTNLALTTPALTGLATGSFSFPAHAVTGALDISGASAGQLVFPASQNASVGTNTLDDYEEGSWTPVVTFGTPGNLNVVYGIQLGRYTKIGKTVVAWFDITTTTFTHTTASGTFRITGLPFSVAAGSSFYPNALASYQGITKASYTSFGMTANPTTTNGEITASGSGQNIVLLTTADIPTGTNKEFHGTLIYEASN